MTRVKTTPLVELRRKLRQFECGGAKARITWRDDKGEHVVEGRVMALDATVVRVLKDGALVEVPVAEIVEALNTRRWASLR
jgi:hypothetical protein